MVIPYEDIVPTVTATGYKGEYDGRPHSITVEVKTATPAIAQKMTIQYSTDGTTWSETPVTYTDAGTHTVHYKVVGTPLTGEAEVEIAPAAVPPAITLTADKTILTGGGDIVFTVSGIPAGAGGTVTIKDDATPTPNTVTATGPDVNGNYTAQVSVGAISGSQDQHYTYTATYHSDNYAADAAKTCEIVLKPEVSGAAFTVTAEGYNGPYDGEPHGITVTASGSDVEIVYCETSDGHYGITPITRTDAGSTVVYYQATKDGHTIAGSATIFISKVNPPMAISGEHHHVYDVNNPLTLTITGVPAGSQGVFSLTSNENEVENKTFTTAADGTLTYIAKPRLPEEARSYTFVAVFEPKADSNYNRYVRTFVSSVSLKEPDPLPFNFSSAVSSTPDALAVGSVTIPFDGKAHPAAEFLSFNSNNISVQYAVMTGGNQEPQYSAEVPTFTQAGTYTVLCQGSDKHGELAGKLLTLTVTITDNMVKPDLQLTASPAVLPGGGQVTLTLTGVPSVGTVALTCNDPAVTIPDGWQGSFTLTLPATVKTYTFTATYTPSAESTSYEPATALCAVTVSSPTGSSGGGSSGGSGAPAGTTNPDGSVTTTTTDYKTGAVTTTTQQPNGSITVVETQKDGTVTTTDTALSGVVVQTVSKPEADTTVTVTVPDGSGDVSLGVSAHVSYTTVVVDTATGQLVNLSAPDEDLEKMLVKLGESADLVLQDRPNQFEDIQDHWAEDAIDFSAAHDLFKGTSETQFSPELPMTRAMMVTILARFDGEDTTQGDTWYDAGAKWAAARSISDGSNLDADVTREQLVTMLWRYAGCPTTTGTLDGFADAVDVNPYAQTAMRWAVKQGILRGTDAGALAPTSNATRAQVSAIMLRFCRYMVK